MAKTSELKLRKATKRRILRRQPMAAAKYHLPLQKAERSFSLLSPRRHARLHEEACAFRAISPTSKRRARRAGVSVDPVKAHDKFIENNKLPFTLWRRGQENRQITAFGQKSFMGRKYWHAIA